MLKDVRCILPKKSLLSIKVDMQLGRDHGGTHLAVPAYNLDVDCATYDVITAGVPYHAHVCGCPSCEQRPVF
jgi:hypothetical protein